MNKTLLIDPPVLAHRGASACAPENTLAAFGMAKAIGVNWVELDVMLTADGELVVFHDQTLERTTSGQGKLSEKTYAELKDLDAGSWFGNEFASQKIPTLEETLACLAHYGLNVNIELKPSVGQEAELAKKVVALVNRVWPQTQAAPLFSSFSLEALRALRAESTQAQIGLLMDEFLPKWKDICLELNCASLNINQAILNPESLSDYKSANLPILTYTVNNPERAQQLFSWGVTAFFSDCPDQLIPVLSAE